MKKLMTSLLAVLLCGFSLCWADAVVKVSVTFSPGNGSQPTSEGLTGTVALYQNDAAVDGLSATLNSGVATISNVPAGTYTIKFTGDFQGKDCTGDRRDFEVGTGAASNNATVETSLVATLTSTGTDPNPSTVSMVVEVQYEYMYWGSMTTGGLTGATVTVKEGTTEIGTKLTEGYYGQASFSNIDATKDYTITVTKDGYKDTTLTTKGVEKVTILMRDKVTTVSGTLKLGEEALTALPDGMSLIIRTNGTNYTAQINENGYTVNCKAGEAKAAIADENAINYSSDFYENLSTNYKVTSPDGTFTIPNAETFTQNIVISKTAATVFVKTNPDDDINRGELMLTKEGSSPIYGSARTEDYKIVFNGVPAGTYTVALNRFGAKLKGTAPTVTVGNDFADQTVETIEIEANPETVTLSGVAKYTNLKDRSTVYLTGAVAKLYAAKNENGWVKVGDALETKTVGEDGKFSFTQIITKPTTYILTLTHDAILPFEDYETVSSSEKTFDVNPKVIWVSGSITNADDLSGDATLTFTYNGSTWSPNNANTGVDYDRQNAKYYVYARGAAPDPATYQLTFKGQDVNGFVMEANADVTITEGAITKDLTAIKDENKGYMTVRLRYINAEGTLLPVAEKDFRVIIGENTTYFSTDKYGNKQVLLNKTDVCDLFIGGYGGYQDTTVKDVPAFFTDGQGVYRPNDLTVYMRGADAKYIKISGNVDASAWPNMGTDVKIALQTFRDKKVIYANIVENAYKFDSVPVFDAGGDLPIFLTEPDAKLSEYGVYVPYNYNIQPATIYVSSPSDKTADVKVYRIACNVSGTVSPAKTGNVTLTAAGETAPSLFTEIYGGAYKFQGVPAGTYTLTVKCDGYKTVTKEMTVAAALEDVTVDAITLEAVPMTVTVSGSLAATNPNNNDYVTFDGAKLAIYNGTEKLKETTLPEESWGYIPTGFTFEAMVGTKVTFKMEHPSIEPVSKEYTVNGSTLTISASDLGYVFIDNTPDEKVVMTNFDAKWNDDFSGLKLSWTWPEAAGGKIQKITMSRKLTAESGMGVALKTWEKTGENPHETYTFAADELPVAYTDTVKQSLSYTYMFEILYADRTRKDVAFTADMRDGQRYKLAYTVNSDKMGTLTSYGQPEGEYLEGDQITLTATAKEGYKFVEFLKNDEKLSEAELAKLTLYGDTTAIYGFKMPAYDLTVKAVFASKSGVEYTVTLVSSNEAWGTVSGNGTFVEGTEIEVKATVTDEVKYKFVAWKEGDKVVSEDATYKFTVEKDITLTAVFQEKVANENLKAARWAIFAEDGAIVIKGINGDRYDIYDLNGRLSGSALCTGAEIRLNVAKSKLYIVRRLGADGSFDAKKIVVR